MAKKPPKVKIPDNICDYYAELNLNRQLNSKDICKALRKKHGEVRSYKSAGALNGAEATAKLDELEKKITDALKIFKNDDRRKEYDLALDAAYRAGKINVQAQQEAQDLYKQIEAMFYRGDFNGVIRKCMEAFRNNVQDYRIIILLARSYFELNDFSNSLTSVDNGLNIYPNNFQLLRTGSYVAREGAKDFNKAQQYINKMMEIDPDNGITVSEQSNLYLDTDKEDLAYRLIDDYIAKHPDDYEFRRDCAYDLVAHSYDFYTETPSEEGESVAIIASKEAYERCLATRNKAASIYNDENIQRSIADANYFGQIEYNDENSEGIKWLWIGTAAYGFIGLMLMSMGNYGIGIGIFLLLIAGFLGFSAIKLRKCSYRPYWQINKYILTGKREKEEKIYITIGTIFTWFMKIMIELIKIGFRLVFYIWEYFV
ncbi:hypothetical protein [Ruminococcus sp.]|uniref:tetratricopeptide repeat protein n=1 Tax=Ruminococcus sp. TaxID=41978 RepID=UPI0025D13438|nr:hypothetical protein [Ruminococcus sp.]MBR1433102.1 hypothetical protein [Ruminococcus sp.]